MNDYRAKLSLEARIATAELAERRLHPRRHIAKLKFN